MPPASDRHERERAASPDAVCRRAGVEAGQQPVGGPLTVAPLLDQHEPPLAVRDVYRSFGDVHTARVVLRGEAADHARFGGIGSIQREQPRQSGRHEAARPRESDAARRPGQGRRRCLRQRSSLPEPVETHAGVLLCRGDEVAIHSDMHGVALRVERRDDLQDAGSIDVHDLDACRTVGDDHAKIACLLMLGQNGETTVGCVDPV